MTKNPKADDALTKVKSVLDSRRRLRRPPLHLGSRSPDRRVAPRGNRRPASRPVRPGARRGLRHRPRRADVVGALALRRRPRRDSRDAARRQRKSNGRAACFCNGNAAKLPFQDGTFDAVTCLNFLHLFPEKDAKVTFLEEMARVLKPGGTAVVEFDNAIHGAGVGPVPEVLRDRYRVRLALDGGVLLPAHGLRARRGGGHEHPIHLAGPCPAPARERARGCSRSSS